MKNKITFFAFFLFFTFLNITFAQDGANDPTFNPEDTGYFNGTNTSIRCVAVQHDGKVLIGGHFTHYKGVSAVRLARLNSDQSLDADFQVHEGADGLVNLIAVQPDGKIYIAGDFAHYNDIAINKLARLNADGSLDTSFVPLIESNYVIKTIKILPDNKILLGGSFGSAGIIRLNEAGAVDTSFIPDLTIVNVSVNAISLQSDNKIVVGGLFTYNNGQNKNIIRLDENGTIDNSFVLAGQGPNNEVYDIVLHPDGIVASGRFRQVNGVSKIGVAKFNYNGGVDDTFFSTLGPNTNMRTMIKQEDNKMIISGIIDITGVGIFNVARLNADGTFDETFAAASAYLGAYLKTALQPDGKVVVTGEFLSYSGVSRNNIVRLNTNGTIDETFSVGYGTGADDAIYAAVQQGDGKILIGGSFTHYNGISVGGIARLTEDGELDTTFNVGGVGAGYNIVGTGYNINTLPLSINRIVLQPDGKIIIAGTFATYNGVTANTLARLHADGSLDTTFNAGTGLPREFNFDFYSFAMQPDGKLLVGGDLISSYNGTNLSYERNIFRLNNNGSIDTAFNVITGYFGVNKILVQNDGKIIFARGITEDNPSFNSIIRLNANGTQDDTFTPVLSGFIRFVTDMFLMPDGKILVAGNYLNPSGTRFVRLNPDGSVDDEFNYPSGTSTQYMPVNKIIVQNDNKIIVTGGWSRENSILSETFNRINSDGSFDATFNSGTGTIGGGQISVNIRDLFVQANGKLVIAGEFYAYNGTGRNRIARISTSGSLSTPQQTAKTQNVFAYKSNDALQVESVGQNIKEIKVYDMVGRLISDTKNVNALSTTVADTLHSHILIVNVTLADDTVVSKKIYY
ncbi:delta-60 repeat domain-containing protein [Flavobacterium sp. Sd200]|uniref:delta-60 repeat domain-containing protein n=1 Tax=Flavobacterium sp. Sd200 TaxID=2692211 RepID=UPI00136F775C|nr:delta-60 repeat domain-containing protein [Flavobacterium sp. Sd200]